MKLVTTRGTLASMLGVVAVLHGVRLDAQTPPAIEVERLDGSVLSIENFREHRATVLVFLSSRSPESVPPLGPIGVDQKLAFVAIELLHHGTQHQTGAFLCFPPCNYTV